MSVVWNPWHGCHKHSEGCRNCYVYRRDAQFDKASYEVRQTAAFDLPVRRTRDGRFKIPAGEEILTCFTSDFLVEEADAWRGQIWQMMRLRRDLSFLFFTKRIERFALCLPDDWGAGYENVTVGCTVENQAMADYRLPIFLQAPIRRKLIICAPLLEAIELSQYLTPEIEELSVGGESGPDARVCDYEWVLSLHAQCLAAGVPFCFHQTGARLLKEGHLYQIERKCQRAQARRANIDVR